MKQTIEKKVYNTDTAKRLCQKNFSVWGDPAGYSEELMVTPRGNYFIYGVGGKASRYPTPTICPVTAAEAKKMQA